MLTKICPVRDSPDVFFNRPCGDIDHRGLEAVGVRQFCLFKRDGTSQGRLEC